jgi:hypothetical protein
MRPYVPSVRFVFESASCQIQACPVMTGLLAGAPGQALRVQDGEVLESPPAPVRTRIPKMIFGRGFPAGTMDGCAGSWRHDVPSCRQNRGAPAPRLALSMDIRYGLTVSGSCPARTIEMADRTSGSDRHLDREPPNRPVFGLGMRHWAAPDPPRNPDPPRRFAADRIMARSCITGHISEMPAAQTRQPRESNGTSGTSWRSPGSTRRCRSCRGRRRCRCG